MAAKKNKGPSKTDFVRSLAADITPDDAIAKAKEAGIDLSKAVYYSLRSSLRKQAGKPAKKSRRGKRLPTAVVAAATAKPTNGAKVSDVSAVERQLWGVIDHHGIVAVRELVAKIERQLAVVRRGG